MATVTFSLPSGADLEVESSHQLMTAPGVVEAGPLEKLTSQDWKGAIQRVADLANDLASDLRNKIKPCKEVTIEFGVSIGGKTGVILVEGTVDANLKITLTL